MSASVGVVFLEGVPVIGTRHTTGRSLRSPRLRRRRASSPFPAPTQWRRGALVLALQAHGVEADARQILVALAAGIAPHADAPQEHAGLHNYQSPLAVRELGVA